MKKIQGKIQEAGKKFCLDCTGSIPKEVENCSFRSCHVYPHRYRQPEGFVPKPITLQAIRKECLWCYCGDANGVRECNSPKCALFPFRMGKNPHRAGAGNHQAVSPKIRPQKDGGRPPSISV